MDPFSIFLIITSLVSVVQTFSNAEANRKQKEYEAQIERNNAIAKQQQAELTRKKTEVAARAKGEDEKKLKREYTAAAGTNRSLLAAGNVDLTTGSALDLLEGNFNRFADDMGELEYEKALTNWEGRREAQLQNWEADVHSSNASYLEKSAGSIGTSLLSAGFSGLSTYASGKLLSGLSPSSTGATGSNAYNYRMAVK
jgi:hypothetical protein